MAENNSTEAPEAPAATAASNATTATTATTGGDNELAAETLEALQALPAVNKPTAITRSPFIKKFTLLDDVDPRRLELVDGKKNATHVCNYCNECVHFGWRTGMLKGKFTPGFGTYDTTTAIRHLTLCTGGGKDCEEIIANKVKSEASKKRKIDEVAVKLELYHAERGETEINEKKGKGNKRRKTQQMNIEYMMDPQSYRDRALCAQAHFFLYSKSSVPMSIFEDPLFKEMLKAMIPPSCVMEAKDPPLLNRFGAVDYADSEFNLFTSCLNKELAPMVEESKGNPFTQVLHDGVTLGNRSKYQAFGLQFTNAKFECNHVVALGFKKVRDSRTVTVSELGESLVKSRTNFDFKLIVSSSVQDAAAKSVAKAWDLEVETCDMHDGDKLGASAIGRLVRKDGRTNVINPFPEGQELEKKLNQQAKHFSSSSTNRQRYLDIIGSVEDEDRSLPQTMIKQDLCGTRMSSYHGLVRSTLKIKKCLDLYFATRKNERNSTVIDYLSPNDWSLALETEAILNISKNLVTISQTETKLNASYGPVLRNATYNKLTSDTIEVIDLENWCGTSRAPRKEVNVNTFSELGRVCRHRATLECERRFFGNDGEETMDAEGAKAIMKLSNREKAALVLDKRTCMQSSILSDKESWIDAKNELEKFYVKFYQQRKRYDRENAKKNNNEEKEDSSDEENTQQTSTGIIDIFGDSGSHSDSDSDSSNEMPLAIDEQRQVRIDALEGAREFKMVIKKWVRWKPDWKKLFPSHQFTTKRNEDTGVETLAPDPVEELIHIDMGVLMKRIERHNEENKNVFGYLPMMCRLSPCQLGALNAQSFVEMVNLCAKLIISDKQTSLRHELIDKLVKLHMNLNS